MDSGYVNYLLQCDGTRATYSLSWFLRVWVFPLSYNILVEEEAGCAGVTELSFPCPSQPLSVL